ncbi:phosphatidylinositol mannoside acyltransferase [Streptomyces sp. 8K308]|uniref:phosphatidylinositol mannoside acyltransferase n=1 Tax=Streptomyces sp. 8K308 TaxID=2530388 RepID=UPI00104BD133|nr:phosphatidylinositol mannoside acyltransferase [Streptomyces sp. 8K308]TDC26585.1 phosphatidylinositol mannoside acyltransferase [Streptomyces sp. 8K308]
MRDGLTDAMYGLGWAAVKRLPEPVAMALGRRVADIAWRRRGPGVRRLEANLARVVPDAGPERLRELSRAGMRSYLRYWMESFRLPAWSRDRIRSSFAVADIERVTDAVAEGRGVVLALPHMGNWDVAGAWLVTALDLPFATVAERLKPERLFDRFVAYREKLGMEVLPHTGSSLGTLARRLRSGGIVCLVADRDLSTSGIEVSFFGETARMPAGPALLAQQTGALLCPVSLWYDETRVIKGRVHPPIPVPDSGTRAEKTAAMTQAVADAFAAGIAEHPEDWHMLQRLWLSDLAGTAGAVAEPRAPRAKPPVQEAREAPEAREGT